MEVSWQRTLKIPTIETAFPQIAGLLPLGSLFRCVCAVVETQTQQRMGVCVRARACRNGGGEARGGDLGLSQPRPFRWSSSSFTSHAPESLTRREEDRLSPHPLQVWLLRPSKKPAALGSPQSL